MAIDVILSVVMPVYNAEAYCSEAVLSVLPQLSCNVELVVVDDCSTDNSFELIKEIIDKRDNVFIMQNTKNMGVSYTRNRGVRNSRGRYVAFIDSDDVWEEGKIREDLRIINEYEPALIYSIAQKRTDTTGTIRRTEFARPKYIGSGLPGLNVRPYPGILFRHFHISTSNVVIRREIALDHQFDENTDLFEDTLLWYLAASEGPVYFNNAVMAYYSDRSDSLSIKTTGGNSIFARRDMYSRLSRLIAPRYRHYVIIALMYFMIKKFAGLMLRARAKDASRLILFLDRMG